ncbi:PAS/PAC sensor signal transduction histidine kinase [Fibrella aestuarina BUZ 2]|uniref:histidine kinase n=1 Tax=Fibrella aestuarina BUZ 2 TaxID=1166018 RepID=I0K7J6_9BACT|nr:sensor histidine kinase [Fibrella aestuarina]CCH00099.1 PAS/PAC sensor signal transduction histidine kinase [Fibrella aestuarina BUZ 2]
MRFISALSQQLKNRRIAVGFVVAVLLVGFGFAMSVHSYNRSQRDNQNITHSFQVLNRLEDILSLTKDVETAVRGYLGSNDRVFLAPYYSAYPRIPGQLDALRKLYGSDSAKLKSVDTLEYLVGRKLAIARKQIWLTAQNDMTVRREHLLIGKLRMDKVRAHAGKMIASEQRLMEQRSVLARASFGNTLVIIFALSMLTFIALVTLYRLLDNELRQRAENEAQLRAYEQQLQEKIQQLETSNQELERMAFVASHDMQEPLRKIRAFGDLLTQRFSPSLEDDGRMFLSKIITSADRMSMLIRDLLNFSRLTSRRDLFVPVTLNELVDKVIGDLELPIQETNATVSRGELPIIDAATLQLEQLFLNLITNALKYVQPGVAPQVRIEAEVTDSALHPGLVFGERYVRLTIRDNGIGFDEKYLDRIFDIFQRLHNKTNYEGTGIGLAICKRVVTYHNGYITAQSQEGVGTTFIVLLPEKQPKAAPDLPHAKLLLH